MKVSIPLESGHIVIENYKTLDKADVVFQSP